MIEKRPLEELSVVIPPATYTKPGDGKRVSIAEVVREPVYVITDLPEFTV